MAKDYVVGKGGKKSRAGPDTYAALEAGVLSGALPDPNDDDAPDCVTVEWMDCKHHRETGERFKLRFDMLVPESLFEQKSRGKVITPESTSIKPKVIKARDTFATE